MTDEKDIFLEQLDRLLSEHRDRVDDLELAELLHSTANGLVALLRPRPAWIAEHDRLEIPYVTPEQLEGALEDLLSRKAICVRVDGVPMMRDVTLRVVAGDRHVDLQARSIQETAAGSVLQIQTDDVGVQRDLLTLAGVLRSVPADVPVAKSNGLRLPELSDGVDSPEPERCEEPPAAPSAPEGYEEPPTRFDPPSEADDEPPDATSSLVIDRRRFETQPLDVLEEAESRLFSSNCFEILGVHFAADTEEVREARQSVVATFGSGADWEPGLRARVRDVYEGLIGAADQLLGTAERRAHRDDVVDDYKLQTAREMFARHAETAKMRRDFEAAVLALRRVVELMPDDEYARRQLAALRQLL